jgi:serine/threonine protein kinase
MARDEQIDHLLLKSFDKAIVEQPPSEKLRPLRRLGNEKGLPKWLVDTHVLASGGFNEIVLGYDIDLQRKVAIKKFKPTIYAELSEPEKEEEEQRLKLEAQALAKSSHPHLLNVYDIAELDGHFCFIMEWVDPSVGLTMKSFLKQGRKASFPIPQMEDPDVKSEYYPPADYVTVSGEDGEPKIHLKMTPKFVLDFVVQLSSVVDHLCRKKRAHLDVKPGNIFITHDSGIKVGDMGISQGVIKSKPGIAHGTIGYVSPEILSDLNVEEATVEQLQRSELFNVANMVYELISGKSLFIDEDKKHSDFRILMDNMAGSSAELLRDDHVFVQGLVDLGLNYEDRRAITQILGQALSSDPGDRQASPLIFAKQIEAVLLPYTKVEKSEQE